MSYRMWKNGKSNDYKTIDRMIGERYRVGGVDMWLYTYIGAKASANNTDTTKSDYKITNNPILNIGDNVLQETPFRKYNLEAITLPVVYQIQEATPDFKLNGLFFFDTMDITLHYNTMMQLVGRKILPGDVIELPNLRDEDVLGSDTGINRFFQVKDAFKTSEGYSATWLSHIYKLRVTPLTNSPEFSDILGNANNEYPDQTDPNNDNSNNNSTYNKEMEIMNNIVYQADNEVPYIHWDNEHIYNDVTGNPNYSPNILSGYKFPVNPPDGTIFIKLVLPKLFEENEDKTWSAIDVDAGETLPYEAEDCKFFFLVDDKSECGFTLYQYYKDEDKWVYCNLPYTPDDKIPDDATNSYYVRYYKPVSYQYTAKNKVWELTKETYIPKPFSSRDIQGNMFIHDDCRPSIPPARGTVPEGVMFPENPTDGMYYYRTDYTPVTLWQYNKEKAKWTQFDYGGRVPWTGANIEMSNFVNSDDRVNIHDVVKPNIIYRNKK